MNIRRYLNPKWLVLLTFITVNSTAEQHQEWHSVQIRYFKQSILLTHGAQYTMKIKISCAPVFTDMGQ